MLGLWSSVYSPTAMLQSAAEHRRLELRVTPLVCQAPCSIRVIARVDPHPDNRYLTITLDSGTFFASSTIPINGDHDPPTQDAKWFKDIPRGEYSLDGFLQAGSNIVAHESVHVLVGGGLRD